MRPSFVAQLLPDLASASRRAWSERLDRRGAPRGRARGETRRRCRGRCMLTAISRYGARVCPTPSRSSRDCSTARRADRGTAYRRVRAARSPSDSAARTPLRRRTAAWPSITSCRRSSCRPAARSSCPALTFWVVPEIARAAGLDAGIRRRRSAHFQPRSGGVRARDHAAHARGRADASLGAAVRHGLRSWRSRERHNLRVIEDCAHALGATYRGRTVGTFGDAAFFSFQTLKPLNTYGGGMAVARHGPLAQRVRAFAESEPWPSLKDARWNLFRDECSASRRARTRSRGRSFPSHSWPHILDSTPAHGSGKASDRWTHCQTTTACDIRTCRRPSRSRG